MSDFQWTQEQLNDRVCELLLAGAAPSTEPAPPPPTLYAIFIGNSTTPVNKATYTGIGHAKNACRHALWSWCAYPQQNSADHLRGTRDELYRELFGGSYRTTARITGAVKAALERKVIRIEPLLQPDGTKGITTR